MNDRSIIVFDIDGTLTDSVITHQMAFEAALSSYSFPALRTDWTSYKHHSDSAIFTEAWMEAQFHGTPDVAGLERIFEAEYDSACRIHTVVEVGGAARFLSQLALSNDWSMVFATGSLRYAALKKLDVVGIDPSQVVLITASEFQTRQEIVRQAVRLGQDRYEIAKPRRVVSVGDGVWDRETAQNLGYEFVGIADGY